MLISFNQITLDQMNEEDMQHLAEIILLDPNMEEQYIYDKLATGAAVPWRLVTDKGTGIMLLEVRDRRTERTLNIFFVAGEGIHGSVLYILDTVIEFAKLHNCTAVDAFTKPCIGKYLCRPETGFETTHYHVRKELH